MRFDPASFAAAILALAVASACGGDAYTQIELALDCADVQPADAAGERTLELLRARLEGRDWPRLVDVSRGVVGGSAGRIYVTVEGELSLVELDLLLAALRDPGELGIALVASGDLAEERAKLDAWRATHTLEPISAFDRVPAEAGGPRAGLIWRRDGRAPAVGEPIPLVPEESGVAAGAATWRFDNDDVAAVLPAEDPTGAPALAIELVPEAGVAFESWTGENVGRTLAVVVNDLVLLRAPIAEALSASSLLVPVSFSEAGSFEAGKGVGVPAELQTVRRLAIALRGGPLPCPLHYLGHSIVGPEELGLRR